MTARLTMTAAALALAACNGTATNTTESTTTATTEAMGNDVAMAPADNGSAAGESAVATLKTADGKDVGTATATETGGAIQVALNGMGMPPGIHGIHVHTTGKCEGPKFTTAGGHWNPTSKMHGTENPKGPHAGDLPNLTVAADGSGQATLTLPAGTMAGLLDADGAAFVVHAKADDYKTDPAGDSGDRIACGVFMKSGA